MDFESYKSEEAQRKIEIKIDEIFKCCKKNRILQNDKEYKKEVLLNMIKKLTNDLKKNETRAERI